MPPCPSRATAAFRTRIWTVWPARAPSVRTPPASRPTARRRAPRSSPGSIPIGYIATIGRTVVPPELLPESEITRQALELLDTCRRSPACRSAACSTPLGPAWSLRGHVPADPELAQEAADRMQRAAFVLLPDAEGPAVLLPEVHVRRIRLPAAGMEPSGPGLDVRHDDFPCQRPRSAAAGAAAGCGSQQGACRRGLLQRMVRRLGCKSRRRLKEA